MQPVLQRPMEELKHKVGVMIVVAFGSGIGFATDKGGCGAGGACDGERNTGCISSSRPTSYNIWAKGGCFGCRYHASSKIA